MDNNLELLRQAYLHRGYAPADAEHMAKANLRTCWRYALDENKGEYDLDALAEFVAEVAAAIIDGKGKKAEFAIADYIHERDGWQRVQRGGKRVWARPYGETSFEGADADEWLAGCDQYFDGEITSDPDGGDVPEIAGSDLTGWYGLGPDGQLVSLEQIRQAAEDRKR